MTARPPTFNGGCNCSGCWDLSPAPEPLSHEPRLETDEWAGGAA